MPCRSAGRSTAPRSRGSGTAASPSARARRARDSSGSPKAPWAPAAGSSGESSRLARGLVEQRLEVVEVAGPVRLVVVAEGIVSAGFGPLVVDQPHDGAAIRR